MNVRLEEGIIVIGGGTMGRGIAQFFLQAAIPVTLVEINEQVLSKAEEEINQRILRLEQKGKLAHTATDILARLTCSQSLEGHDGGLIIEAIIEDIGAKQKLFTQLDTLYPEDVVIASNTSSLSISEMASTLANPARMVGIHFFNPAPLMPLVEVIEGIETDTRMMNEIVGFLQSLGKTAVRVKDTPGFIVNRVARPYYNEALKIAGEKSASIEQVDRIMKDAGFPMGPFELQDLIGIDINFATTSSLFNAYFQDPRFRPHPMQEQMVKSRRLGRKTGKGYYTYDA